MSQDIQFIGSVSAGFPSPARDYEEEDLDLRRYLQPGQTSVYFARVQGDSMIGAHIPDGATVIIDKAMKAKHRSIIIAAVDGTHIIKQLRKVREGWQLVSFNGKYPPIALDPVAGLEIWGVVTHVIVNLNAIKL